MDISHEMAGKIALVTGTSGIGRASAIRLAQAGASVLACGIDDKANAECAEVAASRGLPIQVTKADVSSADQVEAAISRLERDFGGLDIIVNAAAAHPLRHRGLDRPADLGPLHGGQCRLDLSDGAFRRAGDGAARRRRHRQHLLDPGLQLPAERRRLCRHQGRDPRADARHGRRPRAAEDPRQLDQPRLGAHADPGKGSARVRRAGCRHRGRVQALRRGASRSAASASRRKWPRWSPSCARSAPRSAPAPTIWSMAA